MKAMTLRRSWMAAVVMMVAALMDMLDITIVNVALPTMRTRLQMSATAVEWVVSAYLLAFASVLIIAGRLGDLLGRKRLFLIGVATFGLASLLSSMAWSPGVLIVGRTVQGAAAGILMPQVLATFRALFKGKDRGNVFAVYGAVAGLASALGVVLGGLLTQADLFGMSWRTIFLINVPVAAAVLVATVALVPETRIKSAARPDVLGGAVLMVALVAIVYPLLEGRSAGWPAWTWLMLGLGIAAVVVLGAIESRRTDGRVAPLLQTRLFRIPAYSAGLVVQLVFYLGLQGSSLILALWLQAGQGYSPLRAGLTMVAFSVGAFLHDRLLRPARAAVRPPGAGRRRPAHGGRDDRHRPGRTPRSRTHQPLGVGAGDGRGGRRPGSAGRAAGERRAGGRPGRRCGRRLRRVQHRPAVRRRHRRRGDGQRVLRARARGRRPDRRVPRHDAVGHRRLRGLRGTVHAAAAQGSDGGDGRRGGRRRDRRRTGRCIVRPRPLRRSEQRGGRG